MELLLVKFIKEHEDWYELLTKDPYNIKINKDDNYLIFKYNQLSSDFNNPIVRECRGIILEDKTFKPVCVPFFKFANAEEEYSDLNIIDWRSASVQEKVDGCVDENTLILTNYGPEYIKTISESKRSYKVLTYNHEKGIIEYQDIEGISVKDNIDKQWYEIETDFGNLRLTGNHKVFCVNENKYKRVDELDGSEELQLIEPDDYKLNGRLATYNNIYELLSKNINESYLKGESINNLADKFECSWGLVEKILRGYYNIDIRDVSESKQTEFVKNKTIQTNIAKYGCESVSQNNKIKDKKANTFLKHYGVSNIRKSSEYYKYVNAVCLNKYGKKRLTNPNKIKQTRNNNLEKDPHYYDEGRRLISEKAVERWANSSPEERRIKLAQLKQGRDNAENLYSTRSKIEKRVFNIVANHVKDCKHTFWINKPIKYSYDILFNDIIIEINGDFWHANPKIYKFDDIVNLRGTKYLAKDIWQKDLNKKHQAESLGYKVIYLWESDIKKLTDNQIWELIQKMVIEYESSKNKVY